MLLPSRHHRVFLSRPIDGWYRPQRREPKPNNGSPNRSSDSALKSGDYRHGLLHEWVASLLRLTKWDQSNTVGKGWSGAVTVEQGSQFLLAMHAAVKDEGWKPLGT